MFTREDITTPEQFDEEGAGITLFSISGAIQTWAAMNFEEGRKISVAECAQAFNTTPDIIRDAIKDGIYIFFYPMEEVDPCKQFIELDGD